MTHTLTSLKPQAGELQNPEYFYNLLPVVYRNRDQNQTESPGILRALCALMDEHYWDSYHNIQRLYDSWFIETCPEQLTYCVADTLGMDLMPPDTYAVSQRAHIGHYISYQQHKGTPDMLAKVCHDITGWHSYAIAMNKDIAYTQNIRFLDIEHSHIANFTDGNIDQNIDDRLASVPRNIDIHDNNALWDGGFMPQTLGLYLWPLETYPTDRREARSIKKGLYSFHPFGIEQSLYNYPYRANDGHKQSWEDYMLSLPLRMNKNLFFKALETPHSRLEISYNIDGITTILSADNIEIHELPAIKIYPNKTNKVWIDLKRGRFALPSQYPADTRLFISGCYAFGGDIGGGPYIKPVETDDKNTEQTFSAVILSHPDKVKSMPIGSVHYSTLQDAITAWHKSKRPHALFTIGDSCIYDIGAINLTLRTKQHFSITASHGCTPNLIGHFNFNTLLNNCADIILNGISIDGSITFDGDLKLTLFDCTISPAAPKAVIRNLSALDQGHIANRFMQNLTLDHCITGGIMLKNPNCALTITDSIIDTRLLNRSAVHIQTTDTDHHNTIYPPVKIHASTLHGKVICPIINKARNSIFMSELKAKTSDTDSIRFCYLASPPDIHDYCDCISPDTSKSPIFTSTQYGHAGYMHLDIETDKHIRGGGRDGNEVGAFYHRKNQTRLIGLKQAQHQYFPLDMNINYIFEL